MCLQNFSEAMCSGIRNDVVTTEKGDKDSTKLRLMYTYSPDLNDILIFGIKHEYHVNT